ncbi:D-tagatose-1%2C6-bisphosphate aldolase subunit GatY [uncultured Clostridium sp.]|uniref:class II fructose-bisphosphate aldolase n=1 Tax=Enterocloster citroniae TaxID=358743 RepID=UPI000822F983|nr:class II fructose-bisphosphate aldolase [Enterocloster citroniae]MCB7064552.1 class II fructose-bisphosphate aldolase [Enterocloster citroniae]MCC8084710.1 class II fructose-bisphosphate aldolase [Clostridium sp.]SCH71535.1 D-tagatose-1%2C6-bisphosphate aldolase subunit GatY [uncultured Clostridium sp.]
MPLVQTNMLLKHAAQNNYGVAAVNACNYDAIHWIITAAQRERIPVIVMVPPSFNARIPIRFLARMAKEMAGQSEVPVAVHLDHSRGYKIAVEGIRDGFPSIMVDGSALPYEENVALTARVVETAAVFGVDVEGEIGHVGQGAKLEDIIDADRYTTVEQAVDFAKRTGCNSLAIAVGNAHGVYIRRPHLDFERIRAIRSSLEIPLVLHGGSGIPDEQLQEAVLSGISKFNLFTEFDQAVYNAMRSGMLAVDETEPKGAYYRHLLPYLDEPVVEFLRGRLRLLNPKRITV